MCRPILNVIHWVYLKSIKRNKCIEGEMIRYCGKNCGEGVTDSLWKVERAQNLTSAPNKIKGSRRDLSLSFLL